MIEKKGRCKTSPKRPPRTRASSKSRSAQDSRRIRRSAGKRADDSFDGFRVSQEEVERSWTPVRRAQELIYDAWESTKPWRVKLARRALEVSPDCADAYVILAQDTARSAEEERNLYEKGVAAGERALGPQPFKKYAGRFWGELDTRPYMRARAGLAMSLWKLGRNKEAIAHFQQMLRLNPNDNQGIRYLLSHYLLEERDHNALRRLFEHYSDTTADWAYTRALWLFTRERTSRMANSALKVALGRNGMVPSYLLGEKKIPKRIPEHMELGGESEALCYAAECLDAWRKTEGALDWLMSATVISKLFEGLRTRGSVPPKKV